MRKIKQVKTNLVGLKGAILDVLYEEGVPYVLDYNGDKFFFDLDRKTNGWFCPGTVHTFNWEDSARYVEVVAYRDQEVAVNPHEVKFKVGDKVRVVKSSEAVFDWNPSMDSEVGKVFKVEYVSNRLHGTKYHLARSTWNWCNHTLELVQEEEMQEELKDDQPKEGIEIKTVRDLKALPKGAKLVIYDLELAQEADGDVNSLEVVVESVEDDGDVYSVGLNYYLRASAFLGNSTAYLPEVEEEPEYECPIKDGTVIYMLEDNDCGCNAMLKKGGVYMYKGSYFERIAPTSYPTYNLYVPDNSQRNLDNLAKSNTYEIIEL